MPGRHRTPARKKRDVESSEYAAMLIRQIQAYGTRIGQDPAALTHLRDIEEALRDSVNAGIAAANHRPDQPYSLAEIADILGISRQGMHKRVKLGEVVLTRLAIARGHGPIVRLDDMRKARAATLAAARIKDRTGSPKELTAGPGQADSVSEVNRELTS